LDEAILNKLRILTQSVAGFLGGVGAGRTMAVVSLMGMGVVAAFGFAPGTTLDTVPTHLIARELAAPALAPSAASAEGFWREERIQRGDTLGSVLARLGVTDHAAQHFLRTDVRAHPLYQLRPSKPLRVQIDDDGRLLALRYLAQAGDMLVVDRVGDSFVASNTTPQVGVRLELRSTEIRSSLFAAADDIGLPDAISMQLVDVFSGDIDFYHDLHPGDRFTVVYEVRQVDGEPVGTGKIVAAEFVNKGTAYRAFLWQTPDGSQNYYALNGKSLRKAFLRSPVAFTRIASGFSISRFHPFMQAWRAHKGVDFAAPEGTPVRASGDGKVALAGQQGGYGNVIMLQHNGVYSTVYAHLSRFAKGLKAGARVAQGDVIGYVGQTGWATGPHLHYEFRVNDQQRDPLTIALPNAQPIPAEQKAAYLDHVAPLAVELAFGRGITLAGGE